MNQLGSRGYYSQVHSDSFLKVNEIINSIFAMKPQAVESQLYRNAHITRELLQNDIITHMKSLGMVKLLALELILHIAEESSVQKPRISLMENALGQNKKIRLTASLRNNLTCISETLNEIVWKSYGGRKRTGTEKLINQSEIRLHENFEEFKVLCNEFDRLLNGSDQPTTTKTVESREIKIVSQQLKSLQRSQKDKEEELEANEALIEQLEQIIQKKERRIKQLTEQCQEHILDQKQSEDLIDELQNRNYDYKEEITVLNQRLATSDQRELELRDLINQIEEKIVLQEREIQGYKKRDNHSHSLIHNNNNSNNNNKNNNNNNNSSTQKRLVNKFTFEDFEDDKKSIKDLLNDSEPKICVECAMRKDDGEEIEGMRRILFTQALSLQALI